MKHVKGQLRNNLSDVSLAHLLRLCTEDVNVLSWWRCTRDEVYPWTPVVKDVDRANIHVYSLSSVKMELLCYYKTECDPLCVEFSHVRPNIIHSVEQKISRRGEVSVESCTYEILNAKCHRIAVTCILGTYSLK
ncbi:WD repeat-containing and planar cell polarity effector protein fritz [Diaphorina citri]|uniref:WD repeat-containing and planar cell polarity effector protein fritz n=1 Tax=Diaphorina citri TaxID=121845 RepID=A0A1S3CZK0_DIACI|nr:WD repeat-containing and planar cell polarity effector protein fritz [Diaphorina citri]